MSKIISCAPVYLVLLFQLLFYLPYISDGATITTGPDSSASIDTNPTTDTTSSTITTSEKTTTTATKTTTSSTTTLSTTANVTATTANVTTTTANVTTTPNATTTSSTRSSSSSRAPTTMMTTTPAFKPQRFDAASFVGGIILCGGIIALVYFGCRFYKSRVERTYHQL